jgi:hypothetical protein
VALPSKGRRQREDLGKGRIAICHDDDGSSKVVVDLCYMRIRPATTLRKVKGRCSWEHQRPFLGIKSGSSMKDVFVSVGSL